MTRHHQIEGQQLKMMKHECFHNDKNITTNIKQTTIYQILYNKDV